MNGEIDFQGLLRGSIADSGGGGGSTVEITPIVTSGTKIADVSVNGVEKDLYCPTPPDPPEVVITPVVTSGTKIADVSISGVEKDLYSPDYGTDITALDDRLDTAEYNITDIKQSLSQLDGLAVYRQVIPTGDRASFIANDSMPIIKVTANIEPQQDLQGYDSPWVGGAGKNKLNLSTRASKTVQGITSEVKANNTIVASGTSTGNGDIICPVETPFTMANGETYTISLNGTDIRDRILTIFIGTSYINIGSINSGAHNFTFTLTRDVLCNQVMFRASKGATVNINAKLQIEKGSTATSYAPYSNICPISGLSDIDVSLSPTLEAQDATIYTTNFVDSGNPLTVYGGYIDVISGLLTVTDANIASYAGEALPSTWISDRDVYTSGGTPTTGAQVVYKLASALNYHLTAQQINVLIGQNYIWADTGSIKEVGYLDILHLS